MTRRTTQRRNAMLFEELLGHISKSGPCYRWTITTLIAIASMKYAFNIFLLNLATIGTPFHCANAIIDNKTIILSEIISSHKMAGNFNAFDFTCTMPRFVSGLDSMFYLENSSFDKERSPICSSWLFKPDPSNRWTLFTEYQMVCERSYLADRLQTMQQIGFCFSTIFGPLGDVIGRKSLFLSACYVDLVCHIIIIFVKEVNVLMVLIFLMGFNSLASTVGLILITELVSEKYRDQHGNLVWIVYVMGYSGSAIISYIFMNWRVQLIIVGVLTGVCYIPSVDLLPESPRWLLTQRKTKKAKRTLKEMCEYSGCRWALKAFNVEKNDIVDTSQPAEGGGNIWMLAFSPKDSLCRSQYWLSFFIISFGFFTVALVYYALSFQRGFIVQDPYLNVLISGLLEIPAYFVAWKLSNRAGRKLTTISSTGLCGLGLIVRTCLPRTNWVAFLVSSIVAFFVKFCATIAYSVMLIYGSEVFPTTVRTFSVLFASLFQGIGSILAPELGGTLAARNEHLPYLLYGGMSMLSSLLLVLLPETKNRQMPDKVAEMELARCICCVEQSS